MSKQDNLQEADGNEEINITELNSESETSENQNDAQEDAVEEVNEVENEIEASDDLSLIHI